MKIQECWHQPLLPLHVLSLHVLKLALIQASPRKLETVFPMLHSWIMPRLAAHGLWTSQPGRESAAKRCPFAVQPVLDGVLANYKHWEAASRAPGPPLNKTASAKHG